MSHIEEGKTTLKLAALAAVLQSDPDAAQQHPCLVLLREAVVLAARTHGGELTSSYLTYSGRDRTTNTHLALRIPGTLPRGLGLAIDAQGMLVFKGDPYGHRTTFTQVQQTIVRHYTVLAYAAALRRMRAQVSTQVMEDQVVITGVLHG